MLKIQTTGPNPQGFCAGERSKSILTGTIVNSDLSCALDTCLWKLDLEIHNPLKSGPIRACITEGLTGRKKIKRKGWRVYLLCASTAAAYIFLARIHDSLTLGSWFCRALHPTAPPEWSCALSPNQSVHQNTAVCCDWFKLVEAGPVRQIYRTTNTRGRKGLSPAAVRVLRYYRYHAAS